MRVWMAPDGLHVEPANSGDAAELARLHAQSFFRGWSSTEFAAYLADPDTTPAYIACDAKRTIHGFLLLRVVADEAEVLTLAVAEKSRGRGIGAALMRAGIEDLIMSPIRKIHLEVEADNKPALALYSGLGFARTGERKAYYPKPDGSAATAVVMQLPLK